MILFALGVNTLRKILNEFSKNRAKTLYFAPRNIGKKEKINKNGGKTLDESWITCYNYGVLNQCIGKGGEKSYVYG